ncbi:MAG: hypothetical protein HFJ99_07530 [Eubacterium sp.]|nr:hypothetical protein [Eubacterium sp.]
MIDVKKLKNSEKIRMYRNNFDVESEIRNKCKRELEQLKEQNKKPIGHTLKLILIIIAIISAVLFFVKPIIAIIGLMILIATIIISAKSRDNSLVFNEEYQKEKEKIIVKYNNMGYFPQVSDSDMIYGDAVCGDYDELKECYVCSVDGHPISDWNYNHRCNNSNQCPHCKKRLSAMGPDGWFLEHPPRPIDESISEYFYDI